MIPEAKTIKKKIDKCICIKMKKSDTTKVSTSATKRTSHKLKEDICDLDKLSLPIAKEFLLINRKKTNHPIQKTLGRKDKKEQFTKEIK